MCNICLFLGRAILYWTVRKKIMRWTQLFVADITHPVVLSPPHTHTHLRPRASSEVTKMGDAWCDNHIFNSALHTQSPTDANAFIVSSSNEHKSGATIIRENCVLVFIPPHTSPTRKKKSEFIKSTLMTCGKQSCRNLKEQLPERASG